MKVNEIFHSIQGEGYWTGQAMTFIRLSGCNLSCSFCDTEHEHGLELTISEILAKVKYHHVCITGGEPTEQDILLLTEDLYEQNKFVHVETNGTNPIEVEINTWVTVSPKTWPLNEDVGDADEVKFLCGQEIPNWKEIIFQCTTAFGTLGHFYIMPIDGPNLKTNTAMAIQYVMANPKFKLCCQQHKLLGYK